VNPAWAGSSNDALESLIFKLGDLTRPPTAQNGSLPRSGQSLLQLLDKPKSRKITILTSGGSHPDLIAASRCFGTTFAENNRLLRTRLK
jgi:hypothetical protein